VKNTRSSVDYVALTYDTSYMASVRMDPQYAELFGNNKIKAEEMEEPCSFSAITRRVMIHILGTTNPKTITYRTPTSWWQMLKRDYAPGWFYEKFPIREDVHRVEIKDIFPFPKEKFPANLGDCVRIATIKEFPWRDDAPGDDE
jgi:hypothetical protein